MRFFADLHVHSKHARATSRDLELPRMALWAAKKGVLVLGTGDFTHPAWFADIRDQLVPAEPGLLRPSPRFERWCAERFPPFAAQPTRFLLPAPAPPADEPKEKPPRLGNDGEGERKRARHGRRSTRAGRQTAARIAKVATNASSFVLMPALMLVAALLLTACRTADGGPDDPPLEAVRIEGFSVAAVEDAVARQFVAHGFTARPEAGAGGELVFERPWSRAEMFQDGELTADDGEPVGPMWLRLRVGIREAGPGVVEARSDSFFVADHGAVMREERPLAHHRAAVHAGLLSGARRALLSAPPPSR